MTDELRAVPAADAFDVSDVAAYGAPDAIYVNDDEDADWRVVVTVETDEMSVFDDGDWYGELQWGKNGTYGTIRPDGFDGRAKIVSHDWHDSLWWQPPVDVTDPEQLDGLESCLKNLLEFGYSYVVVELQEKVEHRGTTSWLTVASVSLGAVDLANGTYAEILALLAETVAELLGEALAELRP